jgi:hypothetical protein
VHPDDDDRVPVPLLQVTQFVEDVQAVDAAEGPEIQDANPPPQLGKGVLPPVFSQPPLPISSGARTRERRGIGCSWSLMVPVHGETQSIRT